jgi:hypothetical protein
VALLDDACLAGQWPSTAGPGRPQARVAVLLVWDRRVCAAWLVLVAVRLGQRESREDHPNAFRGLLRCASPDQFDRGAVAQADCWRNLIAETRG